MTGFSTRHAWLFPLVFVCRAGLCLLRNNPRLFLEPMLIRGWQQGRKRVGPSQKVLAVVDASDLPRQFAENAVLAAFGFHALSSWSFAR